MLLITIFHSSLALKNAVQRQVFQEARQRPEPHQNQTRAHVDKDLAGLSRVEGASRPARQGPEILEKTTLLYKINVTPASSMFSYASVLKTQQRETAVEKLCVPEVQANNYPSQRLTVDASAGEAL